MGLLGLCGGLELRNAPDPGRESEWSRCRPRGSWGTRGRRGPRAGAAPDDGDQGRLPCTLAGSATDTSRCRELSRRNPDRRLQPPRRTASFLLLPRLLLGAWADLAVSTSKQCVPR